MSADGPLTSEDFAEVGLDDWRAKVVERLGESSIEDLGRRTPDGVDLKPLYVATDVPEALPVVPWRAGEAGGRWRRCARLERGDGVEAAAAMAVARAAGAEAFWLPFDQAARLGLEADAPGAGEAVGRDGLLLHHGSDLALLLESLTLGGESPAGSEFWLDAGGNALPATATVVACLGAHRIAPGDVVLHCGADPLGSLARDGQLPRDLMKLESEMAVLARFSRHHLEGRAIVVSTEGYQVAGATVAQELAYAVATLGTYLRALEESGVAVEDGAAEIALRFSVGADLFVEVAKLRAARLLWEMLLRSCGVAEPPDALVHAVGSRRTATRRDSWNNLLRSAGQTFAAACGGADVMSLDGFDRLCGPSDERAWRLAQTTQAVLAEEALLGRVADPAAGSYYVESLTCDLARQAWAEAIEIERCGGMREHLLSGRLTAELTRSAEARRTAIEEGVVSITGVTAFARGDEEPLVRPEPEHGETLARAVERLQAHRSRKTVPAAEIAYSRDFVVDELVALATSGATLAELSLHLGDAQGAEGIEALPECRDAEPFERHDDGDGSE
jgi:methylmalonyl-CoA mutase